MTYKIYPAKIQNFWIQFHIFSKIRGIHSSYFDKKEEQTPYIMQNSRNTLHEFWQIRGFDKEVHTRNTRLHSTIFTKFVEYTPHILSNSWI